MGLAVFVEDQVHGRAYAGPEVSAQLSRVLAKAKEDGLLSGIHLYGDTMFNVVQLRQLEGELDAMVAESPELGPDVSSLKLLVERAVRSRGYVWLSGD